MNDFKYVRILQAVTAAPWAILPAKLAIIRDLLAIRAAGDKLSTDEVRERINAATPRNMSNAQGIAVLPLVGTIVPRANLITESSGAVSMQRFASVFRAALGDPDIVSIVIDIDSPGGQVSGVAEMANEIFEARGMKPITAVANHLAASAAYWIASAADKVVVTPSGEVGSIGVFAMHQDISTYLEKEGVSINLISAGKYKVEGNPYEPLTEEAKQAIQGRVNEYYNMFIGDVARNRGVSVENVVDGFGEGRVVGAKTAVSLGMADRVATFDDVISDLLSEQSDRKVAWVDNKDYRQRRLRAMSR